VQPALVQPIGETLELVDRPLVNGLRVVQRLSIRLVLLTLIDEPAAAPPSAAIAV
jgi:hypothetical protein